jgi:hypothetical protein
VRLVDLDPRWVGHGGEHIRRADGSPAPERHGVGVIFNCPCGACESLCYVPFDNPLDGGAALEPGRPLWHRQGETFETLTLTPSLLRTRSAGGCGWHGFITNGDVTGRVE